MTVVAINDFKLRRARSAMRKRLILSFKNSFVHASEAELKQAAYDVAKAITLADSLGAQGAYTAAEARMKWDLLKELVEDRK